MQRLNNMMESLKKKEEDVKNQTKSDSNQLVDAVRSGKTRGVAKSVVSCSVSLYKYTVLL